MAFNTTAPWVALQSQPTPCLHLVLSACMAHFGVTHRAICCQVHLGSSRKCLRETRHVEACEVCSASCTHVFIVMKASPRATRLSTPSQLSSKRLLGSLTTHLLIELGLLLNFIVSLPPWVMAYCCWKRGTRWQRAMFGQGSM